LELQDFTRQLNGEVRDRVISGTGDSTFSEQIFTELVFEYLSEIGMVEEPELCYLDHRYKRSIIRLNGFSFSADGDELDLFVTLFLDLAEPVLISKDKLVEAGQQGARFFIEAMQREYADAIEPSHPAHGLAKRIHEHHNVIRTVRIFVLTDGLAKENKFKPVTGKNISVAVEVMDAERLYRGMQAGLPRDEIAVDFVEMTGKAIPCVYVPETGGKEYSACLTVFPGDVLATLYERYGARLLELNVRSFLSITGKVNKGIRETIRTRPDRFLAYNNGIVMTVDEIVVERMADGQTGLRSIRGLQIVNGGQTTASIHRARKTDKADLSNVYVPAKITRIQSDKLDEIVGMISRFANSQNTVQPADFSANDAFHVEVEKLAGTIWCPNQQGRWFYERARGSYQVALFRDGNTPAKLKKLREIIPPNRKFSKPELAKYLNAWDQKPHVVSLGSQKNFDAFMQSLQKERQKNWLPDSAWYHEFIAKAIIFRETQRLVQRLYREEKIKAQPANVSAYLVSCLSACCSGKLDFARVWKLQDISDQLRNLLSIWAISVDKALRASAGGKMVSEWAKKRFVGNISGRFR